MERPAEFELYKDDAGEYRWRLSTPNGNIMADSGEGYSRPEDARRALDRFRDLVGQAEVKERHQEAE